MQHSQVFLNMGNLGLVHSRRKNHSLAPFDVIKLSRGLQDVFCFSFMFLNLAKQITGRNKMPKTNLQPLSRGNFHIAAANQCLKL